MRTLVNVLWFVAPLLIALLLLAQAGAVAIWAACVLAGLVLGLVSGFALVWRRDLSLVASMLRRIAAGSEPKSADLARLTLLAPVADEAERLSRRLASRAKLTERSRRADGQVLDRLPDPLMLLSADRALLRSNSAARSVLGDELPALLRHPGLRAAIDRALATGGTETVEIGLTAPVQRHIQADVVPMDPPLPDDGAVLLLLSDRTREHAVEQMRADFVANASHELRSPLASLLGFIETLRGAAADDPRAQQRFLAIMAEQGARMGRLIDDLLSLSRIELTEHQPPSERVDPRLLLTRVAAEFEPRLAERKVRLAIEMAEDLPPVLGDADQLAQVMQNLLDNGMKYGRDGGTLRLVARSPAAEERRWPPRPGVVVAVIDQGVGIPRQHLPRLTERFYRVDKGRSRAVGGTGLGLAIVKHIVNRHRGQLAIDSEEGVGTTVSFWLPAAGEP